MSGVVPAGGSRALYVKQGTVVEITAQPDAFQAFLGWSGGSSGSNGTVSVRFYRPMFVNGTFAVTLASVLPGGDFVVPVVMVAIVALTVFVLLRL